MHANAKETTTVLDLTSAGLPTLRIRARDGHIAGAWITDEITAYHRAMLAECRTEEPAADWHMESRGTVLDWHRLAGE